MNAETYPKITPVERDHMPVEIATDFLTNRFNRLSNQFRKRCAAARETVYVPLHPVRLALPISSDRPELTPWKRDNVVFGDDLSRVIPPSWIRDRCERVFDTTVKPKSAEARFNGKIRTLPFGKLVQIQRRCDRRSDKVFKQYQKVLVSDNWPEKVQTKLMAHLDAQGKKFDFLHGLTTAEIQRRLAVVKQSTKPNNETETNVL